MMILVFVDTELRIYVQLLEMSASSARYLLNSWSVDTVALATARLPTDST